MNSRQIALLSALLAAAVAASPAAMAAESEWDYNGYFYVGGNIGQSRARIDTGNIDTAVVSTGLVATSATTSSEIDTGYKLFGGYRFHPNIAVEAGYFSLGKFTTTTATTGPAATLAGTFKNQNGFNLDIVAIGNVTGSLWAFARAGVQNSKTNGAVAGVGPGGTIAVLGSDSKTSWKAGLGAQYDFTKTIAARLEWERYRVPQGAGNGNQTDVDLFSLGMLVRF